VSTEHSSTLSSLSDDELVRRLLDVLRQSRRVEADLARASREHPILLEMLGDGRLHLSGIAKLAPHLSVETRDALLARAAHRSRREIEDLVAELAPRPDAPTLERSTIPRT
jgi:hypothetical protein